MLFHTCSHIREKLTGYANLNHLWQNVATFEWVELVLFYFLPVFCLHSRQQFASTRHFQPFDPHLLNLHLSFSRVHANVALFLHFSIPPCLLWSFLDEVGEVYHSHQSVQHPRLVSKTFF